MLRFIGGLIRPYRSTLVGHFSRHAGRDAMSLAAPWPLKIILDNVVGDHKMSPLARTISSARLTTTLHGCTSPSSPLGLTSLIAVIGALASYIDNYYTETVGQWVAHDLRMRMYNHLQRLSLGLLQHAPDRHHPQHHHLRHPDHPGLRLLLHARHPRRSCSPSSACWASCSGSTGTSP